MQRVITQVVAQIERDVAWCQMVQFVRLRRSFECAVCVDKRLTVDVLEVGAVRSWRSCVQRWLPEVMLSNDIEVRQELLREGSWDSRNVQKIVCC